MSDGGVTIAAAPGSVDMVRVIRRSIRCFVFGVIGLMPIFGVGVAVQALRLQRRVAFELKDDWKAPPVYSYWLLGLVLLWAADRTVDWVGELVLGIVLLGLQSWHLWRSFARLPNGVWNPGRRSLAWGVIFAYAGLSVSLWLVGVLICRLTRLSEPV